MRRESISGWDVFFPNHQDRESLMKEDQMNHLTFVEWYVNTAVYLNDKLIYWGRSVAGCWGLLEALGYECSNLREIETHSLPPEYDRQSNGWWKPPETLTDLRRIQEVIKKREQKRRIENLKEELAELEKES